MALFQENTTEIIKSRLNIVDVVSSYIKLEKAGSHYKANCPFHQERTPSFTVNEERNMWHCFGCSRGGDIFAFVMEIEGLQFREALVLLAERAGVELPKYQREPEGQKDQKERLYGLLELAVRFYEHQLWEGVGKKTALPYLMKRGLTEESIKKFRLGYAPEGWRHFMDYAVSKGYTIGELELSGMAIKKSSDQPATHSHYDRFRDRVMFPIMDILGRPIGFSARVAPGADETQAKYINTPETPLYHKSRALYGLSLAKQSMKASGHTVVVEGNVDVIALSQNGVENVVAVSGTALTPEQLDIMKRYGKEVHLFFDMDGAGQKAARKSTELALEKELQVRLIGLESGKDAADMGMEDPEGLKRVVESHRSAPEYFLEKSLQENAIETAEGKRAVVDNYLSLLIAIKNPLERAHWVKELARATHLEEKTVTGVVNQAFLENMRHNGPIQSPSKSSGSPSQFQSRADRLAEEVIALLLIDPVLRAEFLPHIAGEVRDFLTQKPLFFFILQAGEHDPLSLIENNEEKSMATKITFRLLNSPDFAELGQDEVRENGRQLLVEYLEALESEVGNVGKRRTLELRLEDARKRGDKEEEKQLLEEFVRLTRG